MSNNELTLRKDRIEEIDVINTSWGELLEEYNTSMGDPDTSLAIFLYKNSDLKNFELSKEEYMRWDLENNKIRSLLGNLFGEDPSFPRIIDKIDQQRELFIVDTRKIVLADYHRFHGISGMDFQFLVERKDSIVMDLLKLVLNDEDSPIDEREYAKRILEGL